MYGQEAHGEGEGGKLIPFSPFWNFHKVPSQSVALTGGAGRTAVLFTQLLQEGRFVLQLPGESRGTAEQLGILSPPPRAMAFSQPSHRRVVALDVNVETEAQRSEVTLLEIMPLATLARNRHGSLVFLLLLQGSSHVGQLS